MSFLFINDFKKYIYQLLASENFIHQTINHIYLSVTQDAAYPFILINIIKAEDISKFNYNIYNVEFEISVFARDKNQGILILIADKIIHVLKTGLNDFREYIIIGIKSSELIFQKSQDLITTKLSIPYQATLAKGEKNYELS